MSEGSTPLYQPSETLKSRTFIGLLLAQFTATFNDQTIHIVAIFYASDMLVRYVGLAHLDKKAVVSIVTACFITPFLLFSSYAGILADKFSKRTIIVFWKFAELAIMLLALVGFCLPHLAGFGWATLPTLATCSALLVVSTVFLMGFHSTFFVPAKYGAMPEILHPTILSRGNGMLEGTSFMAQIIGTSAGGLLYYLCKSKVGPGELEPGREWMIGALLVVLATIGTFTAVLMERIPVAAPHRKFSWNWLQPLRENMAILWGSKPLTLAVVGIAFAAYMTLFTRQSLIYEGDIDKDVQAARALARGAGVEQPLPDTAPGPRWSQFIPRKLRNAAEESELRVTLQIALVGFGVGIGCLLAGYLSGHRVELGLVPIGGVGMVVLAILLGVWMRHVVAVMVFLFLVGIAAGFYIVPLYTLLQHRAPKERKGNVIAASNFLNVVAGGVAVALFYLTTYGLEAIFGAELRMKDVQADPSRARTYIDELRRQLVVPQLLFLETSLLIAAVMFVLCRQLPDFFVRSAIWWRSLGRQRLRVIGMDNLPGDGPVVLASNFEEFDGSMQVVASTDRFTRIILLETAPIKEPARVGPVSLLRLLAKRTGLITLDPATATRADWDRALAGGGETLRCRDIVAITVDGVAASVDVERLLREWQTGAQAIVVPVYCAPGGDHHPAATDTRVVIGPPLAPGATLADARAAIDELTHVTHDPHHAAPV